MVGPASITHYVLLLLLLLSHPDYDPSIEQIFLTQAPQLRLANVNWKSDDLKQYHILLEQLGKSLDGAMGHLKDLELQEKLKEPVLNVFKVLLKHIVAGLATAGKFVWLWSLQLCLIDRAHTLGLCYLRQKYEQHPPPVSISFHLNVFHVVFSKFLVPNGNTAMHALYIQLRVQEEGAETMITAMEALMRRAAQDTERELEERRFFLGPGH